MSQIIGWFSDPAQYTEIVKPNHGWSFASQVICTHQDGTETRPIIGFNGHCSHSELTGTFRTENSYFIDPDGRKHYVAKCETGKLGVLGEQVAIF